MFNAGKIILLLWLGCLSSMPNVYGQEHLLIRWQAGEIQDAGGMVIRRLTPDGQLQEGSGQLMGRITPQGQVYAFDGMLLAVMHENHTITNREGLVLGYSDKKGVIHGFRKILGTFRADGSVVDPNGTVLASFPKRDRDVATLYLLGELP